MESYSEEDENKKDRPTVAVPCSCVYGFGPSSALGSSPSYVENSDDTSHYVCRVRNSERPRRRPGLVDVESDDEPEDVSEEVLNPVPEGKRVICYVGGLEAVSVGYTEDLPAELLIDSGAVASLVAARFSKRLGLFKAPLRPYIGSPKNLSGGSLRIKGELELTLRLGARYELRTFVVVDRLHVNAILGTDRLKAFRAVIDLDENIINATTTNGDSRLILISLHVAGAERPLRALLDSGATNNFIRDDCLALLPPNNFIRDDCVALLPSHVRVRERPAGRTGGKDRREGPAGRTGRDRRGVGRRQAPPRSAVSLAYAFDGFSTNDDFLVIELNYAFDCILGMPWLACYQPEIDWLSLVDRASTTQRPQRESDGPRCVECAASVIGPVDKPPSRAREGMKKNTVEHRVPYENNAVEQRLPYMNYAAEQGPPHVKNAVEQRLPPVQNAVEQRFLTRGNWKFSRVASSQLPRVQSRRVSNGDQDSEWHKNGTLESVDKLKIARAVTRNTYRLTGTEASHPKQRFGMEL
ncbi:hypothetical protein PR001_g15230 [Phytophthora rubi]|nr:hypothetical protein PR001_g15230 [Phytophthora rubi]